MSAPGSLTIRTLTPDILGGALHLSETAGWNQRLDDWRMLLRIAPAGGFAALAGARIVGTAIGIDYGTFGWIAMMLVDPAYRGHGLGARLLEAAMAALPAGRPIRLDATPMGRPLYERYGFADETLLTRHVRRPGPPPASLPPPSASPVRPAATADLEHVLPIDRQTFGADRGAVLEWMLTSAGRYARVIDGTGGPQYCFGRQGRVFDQIGPVVARDDAAAIALTGAALRESSGQAFVADVFDTHARYAEWLGGCGFEAQRPLFRMCRPGAANRPAPRQDPGLTEYTILGPEFA